VTRDDLFSIDHIRRRVLPCFSPALAAARAVVTPLAGGLINRTFVISEGVVSQGDQPRSDRILQWVNPIFPAGIHDNIAAVTAALRRAGVTTPALIPTTGGAPCLTLEPEEPGASPSVWRLMERIAGVGFDVVGRPTQAFAAGGLVAAFHDALGDLDHQAFTGRRIGVHDTPRHLAYLTDCLTDCRQRQPAHELFEAVRALAAEIHAAAAALPPLPALPERVGHGDLKFNNFLFEGPLPPEADRAVCLVDLDTVGPMNLAHEWGDAWRSWCNRAGEDAVEADLDLEVFAAAWEGYRQRLERSLSQAEREALLVAPDWISLELAARFAADALAERYFGWDPARFPSRGAHNLVRARGQWSLHQAFARTRAARARLLGVDDRA
jgi:aminoglycoside phosphotransferase (APT) family kinase protein